MGVFGFQSFSSGPPLRPGFLLQARRVFSLEGLRHFSFCFPFFGALSPVRRFTFFVSGRRRVTFATRRLLFSAVFISCFLRIWTSSQSFLEVPVHSPLTSLSRSFGEEQLQVCRKPRLFHFQQLLFPPHQDFGRPCFFATAFFRNRGLPRTPVPPLFLGC